LSIGRDKTTVTDSPDNAKVGYFMLLCVIATDTDQCLSRRPTKLAADGALWMRLAHALSS